MSGIIGQNVGRSSGLKKAIAAAGNTPYFLAHRGADGCSGDGCTQSTSDNTFTKAQFNGERLDTDNCYDPSTYRFTPNKAGKYLVYITCNIDSSHGFYYASSEVKKNGSNISGARITNIFENLSSSDNVIEGIFLSYHGIVEMNGSSDYLTATAYMAGSSGAGNIKGNRTIWGAYRLRS